MAEACAYLYRQCLFITGFIRRIIIKTRKRHGSTTAYDTNLGSSANPFLHRPFPFLPDWLLRLSDHRMILLCSTAGFVYMMC